MCRTSSTEGGLTFCGLDPCRSHSTLRAGYLVHDHEFLGGWLAERQIVAPVTVGHSGKASGRDDATPGGHPVATPNFDRAVGRLHVPSGVVLRETGREHRETLATAQIDRPTSGRLQSQGTFDVGSRRPTGGECLTPSLELETSGQARNSDSERAGQASPESGSPDSGA